MLGRKGTIKAEKLKAASLHQRASENDDCRSRMVKMTNVRGL